MKNMDTAQRALYIADILQREYPQIPRFLDFNSPFELLIGVILSAQTTDRQVNKILPALFARFPTPAAMGQASPESIIPLINTILFFRRKAHHIQAAAHMIAEQFGGEVPQSMENLCSLPGVGRKSANVIRGTIFNLPAIIVDTHFSRVTQRLMLVTDDKPHHIEREIAALIPPDIQYRFSMTANLHGRLCCKARAPACHICPLLNICPYPHERNLIHTPE